MRLHRSKLGWALTAVSFSCAIAGCGPATMRGTWDGTLVAIPYPDATTPITGFDVASGSPVPAAYRDATEGNRHTLLISHERRAIDYETLSHLGGRVVVTGRMTFANVKTSDGSGWVCGPPPRGLRDSRRTCWVVEIDTRLPTAVRAMPQPQN